MSSTRVALLFQGAGHYWQPILSEFVRLLPNTVVFTPRWPGFLPGFENAFVVKQVGTMKVFSKDSAYKGYSPSFTYLSPRIVGHLIRYRPEVVFSTAFSIWTMIAVALKPLFGWRVVIVFDGSSAGVDRTESRLRHWQRKGLTKLVDAYITNSHSGKAYLMTVLGADEKKVFARPYLLPDMRTYRTNLEIAKPLTSKLQRPIFVFAGKLIPRKGLQVLLTACTHLKAQGYENYTLLVVGDGEQRSELEAFAQTHDIADCVRWVGKVNYEHVGSYFYQSDVFVFPTYEDVWGLVAVEAMMFGKPILCSQGAGAAEMVAEDRNGYVFDPYDAEKLAKLMSRFIDNPDLITHMGAQSKQIMAEHTPVEVSKFLAEVVSAVS
ncbi:MAG: glycosyltransferase family 4 protein [Cyanobacteria bacterium P01_D01_bin.56]